VHAVTGPVREVRIEGDGYRAYVDGRPAGPVRPVSDGGDDRAFDRSLRDAGLILVLDLTDARIAAQDGPLRDLGVRIVPGYVDPANRE
jgi:hypothetical protein